MINSYQTYMLDYETTSMWENGLRTIFVFGKNLLIDNVAA